MKKIKVTVNEGSPGRTLPLFDSPEAAYVWLTEAGENPEVLDDIPDVDQVALMPGEFIEAEWRGLEYMYDGPNTTKFNLIRFGKAHQPENASGLMVSIHYGWVVDCILPFYAFKDSDITVVPLPLDEAKLDLFALFKDDDEE